MTPDAATAKHPDRTAPAGEQRAYAVGEQKAQRRERGGGGAVTSCVALERGKSAAAAYCAPAG
jgi:hypothetical protein